MWIFITDSAGSKYGAPIRTVARWNNTARLDKMGTFSFEMPAGDSLAALLASKREAHCYDIIGGSVVEVGAGIIDKTEVVVAPQRSTMLRVSGGDLLRELTYRTVGNLGLFAPGQTVTPSSVQHHDPDGATPNTVMTDAFDDDTNTQHDLTLKSDEYIYIRYTSNTAGAIFDLDAGTINNNTATMTTQYFDGGGWRGVAGFSDGTADGGATLAKDGTMSWTRPADAETMVHNGKEGYWIRMTPSANLDEVGFKEVDVNGDGPTATALADIMTYAPGGWAVDAENGYAATENTAYLFFAGENVLEALKILAEHTGEHFYLGAGKKIVWVQDDPVADPTACGYRAVPMYGGMVEANPLVCLIQSLAEIEDGYKRCSRVYPHGAGMGRGRLTLADATDSAGAGYTLAASDNYVKHDAADGALQIDKDITWPEVGRIEEDAIHSVHASNQLLASAVEYLSRHYAAQTSYSLTVVGLEGTVDPGETIPVRYWEYRDGSAIVDIDATLIILESQTAINSEGIRTVALTVATTDTWPKTEGRVVAEHLRKAKRATGGAGPGGMQSGTGGGGDIHIVTHVKHRGDEDTLIRFLDDNIIMDVNGKTLLCLTENGANEFYASGPLIYGEFDASILDLKANVSMGGDSSFNVSRGLTIDQGAHESYGIVLQQDDVAHGITAIAETNSYCVLKKHSGDAGGVDLIGLRDADGAAGGALGLTGYLGENVDTTKGTTARAIVEIYGGIQDGIGIGNVNADGNVFAVRGVRGGLWRTLIIVDEDADLHVLNDIVLTNDLLLADGAVIGIPGNEIITFDAAGTIAITGADVLLGSEDGLGKLNFDEGTAIADGIVWGSDANKVTLYRSADDMLKTDDSLTIALGLNVGRGTGAPLGHIEAIGADGDRTQWKLITYSNTDWHAGMFTAQRARGTLATPLYPDDDDYLFRLIGMGWSEGSAQFENAGYVNVLADGDWANGVYPSKITFHTGTDGNPLVKMTLDSAGHFYPGGDKTQSLGLTGNRWDDFYVDSVNIGTATGAGPGSIQMSHTGAGSVLLVIDDVNDAHNARVQLAHIDGSGGAIDLWDDARANTVKFRSYGDSFILNSFGVGTTTPTNVFSVNEGSGNMLADGYDTYASTMPKEDAVDLVGSDLLAAFRDVRAYSYRRIPFVSAKELRKAIIERFGIERWLAVFPDDEYRGGKLQSCPDAEMLAVLDALGDRLRNERRVQPQWQRRHYGLIAEHSRAVTEHFSGVFKQDERGHILNYSLNNYVGMLHAVTWGLNERRLHADAEREAIRGRLLALETP